MKTKWVDIEDTKIRHVWERPHEGGCPQCPKSATVAPDQYSEIGIPQCPVCGTDMWYKKAQIRVPVR